MGAEASPKEKTCCAETENLERFPTTNPYAFIDRCKVCGRNHYRLKAQPVDLGAKLQTKQ